MDIDTRIQIIRWLQYENGITWKEAEDRLNKAITHCTLTGESYILLGRTGNSLELAPATPRILVEVEIDYRQ
jgi:hypothetical protein